MQDVLQLVFELANNHAFPLVSPTKIVLFLLFTIFVFFEALQCLRSGIKYTLSRPWVWSALIVVAFYEIDSGPFREQALDVLHNLTSKKN